MSEISVHVDARARAKLGKITQDKDGVYIIGEDGIERTPSLLAPRDLVEEFDDVLNYIRGESFFSDIPGVSLPRFGVLSLLAQSTPMHIYDHPALNDICKTGFTDGIHVFINAGFYDKLARSAEKDNYKTQGIEPLVLHELMHKLLRHVFRLSSFPSDIGNKAADLSINTKLQEGFPSVQWCPVLKETGLGFNKGDIEKYARMAEESIARELWNERLRQQAEADKGKDKKPGDSDQEGNGPPSSGQGKGKNQGKGQGPQGKNQGQGQGKGKSDPNGKGGQPNGEKGEGGDQDGDGEGGSPSEEKDENASDVFGDENDRHFIPLEELIKVLEDNDMQGALNALDLPSSDDVEKIGEIKTEDEMRQHEAVQRASAQAQQHGGKYPGGHITECAGELIRGFASGKLQWRLALQEVVLGNGMIFRPDYEEPADIYYVEEVGAEMGMDLYFASDQPFKPDSTVLCLFDTSGSVSDQDLRDGLTEVIELQTAANNNTDSASEVIVYSADTVLRGEALQITEANVHEIMNEGVKMFGRGGTDLKTSLRQTLALPIMKEKKIKTIVFFTDSYDRAPQRSDFDLEDDVQVVFILFPSTSSSRLEEFAKEVGSWARVCPIREGFEVDLTDVPSLADTPTPKRKVR